jgi:hypothetical protein
MPFTINQTKVKNWKDLDYQETFEVCTMLMFIGMSEITEDNVAEVHARHTLNNMICGIKEGYTLEQFRKRIGVQVNVQRLTKRQFISKFTKELKILTDQNKRFIKEAELEAKNDG